MAIGAKLYYHAKVGSFRDSIRVLRESIRVSGFVWSFVSGCTTQGSPAPDAVHQIEDDGSVVYDDDPIAVEPQLDEDELDGGSDDANVQEEIISAEPHKGSVCHEV